MSRTPHGLRDARLRRRFRPAVQRLESRELLAAATDNGSTLVFGNYADETPQPPVSQATSGADGSASSNPGLYADTQPNYEFYSNTYVVPAPLVDRETATSTSVSTGEIYSRTDYGLYGGSTLQFYAEVSAGGFLAAFNPRPPYYQPIQNYDLYSYDWNGNYNPAPYGFGIFHGEPIQLSISQSPAHGTVQLVESVTSDGTGVGSSQYHSYRYRYTADDNYQGSDSFSVNVTDELGNTKEVVFPVSVYDRNLGVSFAPVDQTNQDGDLIDLPLPEFDQHQNLLDYSFQNLPSGLSYDPTSDTITGTLSNDDYSSSPYQVAITATNGYSPADSTQYFDWIVTPASPTIENADDDQWSDLDDAEGQAVSIPVVGSDPDGLPLTYTATGLPSGLAIGSSSGVISGTVAPGADTGATYDVTVSVTNGQSNPDTLEFPWTITQLALTPPSDQFSITGDTVAFPLQIANPRGGVLSYSADDLPDGLAIDPTTGLISGVISASAAGGMPWQVTIDVTDGTETAEHTLNWTVWPGNPAVPVQDGSFANPTVGYGNFQYAPSGSSWTFNGTAGIAGNNSAFATLGEESPQGQQVAFVQEGGSVSQDIPAWTAGSYHVTFAAAQRFGSNQDFQVLVDGTVVATFQPQTAISYLYYTTPAFTVTAGEHTITFQGTDTVGGDNTILLGGVAIIPATAGVPVVNDSGFEQAPIGNGNYSYDPPDSYWDFNGTAGVSSDSSYMTQSNPNAPQGSHVAFLEYAGSLIQAVTDWSSGNYHVSFSAAQRANINGPGEDFEVLLDGVVVATFMPSSTSYQTYTTPDFTVTAGTHALSFLGLDSAGGDNTVLIDGVAIAPAGGTSSSPSGGASLPVLSLTNPGDQSNSTTDVISLPLQGSASSDDELYYTAMGLPAGLDIDPDTGVISGMDDDFNAVPSTTYTVTVTLSDEYGQSTTQTFSWQFNAGSSGTTANTAGTKGTSSPDDASISSGAMSPLGAGFPTQHPTTESRSDNFSIDGFWQNVELLPGGQAAEDWFLGQGGKVYWGWTLSVTHGRFEKQSDGTFLKTVHIPWQNNEAAAAQAFVENITQSWQIGWAGYSNIPTDGSPTDWQTYIKARTKATGQVAVTGAELLLSGLSIVNEGIDFVVTINDVANAKTPGQAAIAAIGLLPFISNSAVRLISSTGEVLLDISSSQRLLIKNFMDDYVTLGWGTYKSFTVTQRAARNGTNVIILQRSIPFSKENVTAMTGVLNVNGKLVNGPGRPPFVKNNRSGLYEQVNLHHVNQRSEANGVLAEITEKENAKGNLLHPGAVDVKHDAAWNTLRGNYWKSRLQEAINLGQVPLSVLQDVAVQAKLKLAGFSLPSS